MAFLVFGFISGMFGIGWVNWADSLNDVRANRVETLEGTVTPLTHTLSKTRADYFITINEKSFRVN